MKTDRNLNANILSHARRISGVADSELRAKTFKVLYLIAFVYTLIIDLAYVLGSVLQLSDDGTAFAAGELWIALLLTLALIAAAASFIRECDLAGLILTAITCGLQFFVFLALVGVGSVFITRHALPLSLLIIFAVLLFKQRRKINARVMAEYERITGALYKSSFKDGMSPSPEELERIFNAFDGELPNLTNRPVKRSVKIRREKEKCER